MKKNLGIMQGRLVPREIKGKLQSFPWKNWKKEILIAKKNKIRLIEWTIDYRNFYKNPLVQNPKQVKKFLDNNLIKVNSLTADFFMQKPPFKGKNKTEEYLDKIILVSKIINLKKIIIPLVDNSSVKNIIYQNKVIEFFSKKIKKLDLNNLKILFELDLGPRETIKFISYFNNTFGINYDTGNSAFYGHKFVEEKKYFQRVKNIHIKDRNVLGRSVPLGKGLVNFKEIFDFLKKIKYSKNFILQTYLPKKNNLVVKHTLENYKYIKKFL